MSNRDRIDRMRAEAEAAQREKKTTRAAAGGPARFKFVWVVKDGAGEIVATYPYARKEAAEAEAERRKRNESRHFMVAKHKVPFDD